MRGRIYRKSSRPTVPCDGPRMNRQVDVGNPPRPFRHLRMAERRTPDLSSSESPFIQHWFKNRLPHYQPAGRLSLWMLGELQWISNRGTANSWQRTCNQSNSAADTEGLQFQVRPHLVHEAVDSGGICWPMYTLSATLRFWIFSFGQGQTRAGVKRCPRLARPRFLRRRF